MSPSKYIIVYSKPFETCLRCIQLDQLTREGMTNIINDPLDRGHIELLHLRVGKRSWFIGVTLSLCKPACLPQYNHF